MSEPTKQDLLEADIDIRLFPLWEYASQVAPEDWTFELAWSYCRAGYGAGYNDCLRDPHPEDLYVKHGYLPPQQEKSCG